ncbi:zinc finger protein [Setomelanomma holmii]|uniref:Zinc finger protein n=1 Tax=Setomelanomma holmii TaxID=210430 RepID=A0A9P4HHB7_9PLEO|nr:zinc finger protein [Setomelanomma holmii]
MAATTRAITPTHTGPFAPPNGPTTPGSTARNGATFGAHLTNSPRGLSPRHSPQPQPRAMSLSDERQYRQSTSRQASPNSAAANSQNLQPPNAPQGPTSINAQANKLPKPAIVIPEGGVTGENIQTSPVSLSSFGDEATAAAANALEASAANTGSVSKEGTTQQQQHHQQHHHQLIAPNPGDNPGNRAFTFPGPLPPEPDPRAPARQMSLPGYGQNTPKSPSTKRHKCPYCSTDFTRHHNLKSHLLTHSQEKPYECPTCQARFRRLHDLKRHTKLHTGERPHTCFKCGRRFARGDALARHNKGQGGCAGRRSSFGMDDDLGDGKADGDMDGIVYTGDNEEGDEDEDDGRRVSEPARKRQNTGNSTQAPSSVSSLHNATQSNVFAHGGMTESPKPLSPGQQEQRRLGARDNSLPGSRSPNLSHHIHQQSLNRGAGRGTPPMGMVQNTNNGPHLPSLPGLNPLASKQGSQAGNGNGPSMLQHQPMAAPGTPSQPGSTSSHGGSGSSIREVMGGSVDVWQFVRDMEARMARTEKEQADRIASLQNEVTTLRAQLAQQHVNNSQPQQQGS